MKHVGRGNTAREAHTFHLRPNQPNGHAARLLRLGTESRGRWSTRRESLQEALRLWRSAERELFESADGRHGLEANVARLRDAYQRTYTDGMVDNISRLHAADDRRARATPSTPEFHAATRDTEEIAADIWEQARRGDRDSPPTRLPLPNGLRHNGEARPD